MFLYQPAPALKVRKRTQGNTNSARTEEVFEHLASSALPANPKTLTRIQALLLDYRNGADFDRDELTKEIISDPGLGLYYLSHLRSILGSDLLPEDPLSAVKTMSGQQLEKLFDVSASQISKHKMTEAGPPQLLRLQHTFIASKAAAQLSKQLSIDEGKAFSLVQLSQAALNLIAWNYPTQFHKALFNQRKFKASLDDSLSSLVGVKTENIINKLAKRMGLPTSLILDLQLAQRQGVMDFSKVTSNPTALSLARVGDLLARANDKEHFPEAFTQWEKVERQLEAAGLENPKDELHEEVKNFIVDLGGQSSMPYQAAFFQTQIPKQLKPDPHSDPSSVNPYIKKLPDKLRAIFEKIYLKVEDSQLSVEALQVFVEELAPSLNLYSGCLFLNQGEKPILKPSLNFGKVKKGREPVSIYSENAIAQSIYSTFPIQFEGTPGMLSICGALPECEKQAVLLMEFETSAFFSIGDKAFTIFGAVATTLVDIIGQRQAK